jgi:hypothetical protein
MSFQPEKIRTLFSPSAHVQTAPFAPVPFPLSVTSVDSCKKIQGTLTTRHQDTISPRKDAFRPSPLLKSFNPASQIANQKFGDPQLSTLNQLSVHPGTAWDTLVTPSVTPWKCKIPNVYRPCDGCDTCTPPRVSPHALNHRRVVPPAALPRISVNRSEANRGYPSLSKAIRTFPRH